MSVFSPKAHQEGLAGECELEHHCQFGWGNGVIGVQRKYHLFFLYIYIYLEPMWPMWSVWGDGPSIWWVEFYKKRIISLQGIYSFIYFLYPRTCKAKFICYWEEEFGTFPLMEETLHQLTDDGSPVIPCLAQVLIRPWWLAEFLNHQQYAHFKWVVFRATCPYISLFWPWDDLFWTEPYSVMSETSMRTWGHLQIALKWLLFVGKRLGCKQESLVVSSWLTKWKASLNKLSFFLSDLFNTCQSNCHLIIFDWHQLMHAKIPCKSGYSNLPVKPVFRQYPRNFHMNIPGTCLMWYFSCRAGGPSKLILLIARDESRPCVTLPAGLFLEPRSEFGIRMFVNPPGGFCLLWIENSHRFYLRSHLQNHWSTKDHV